MILFNFHQLSKVYLNMCFFRRCLAFFCDKVISLPCRFKVLLIKRFARTFTSETSIWEIFSSSQTSLVWTLIGFGLKVVLPSLLVTTAYQTLFNAFVNLNKYPQFLLILLAERAIILSWGAQWLYKGTYLNYWRLGTGRC